MSHDSQFYSIFENDKLQNAPNYIGETQRSVRP